LIIIEADPEPESTTALCKHHTFFSSVNGISRLYTSSMATKAYPRLDMDRFLSKTCGKILHQSADGWMNLLILLQAQKLMCS